MQDNVNLVQGTHQYWMNISSDGHVEIPRVIADEYRLTIYAEGPFSMCLVKYQARILISILISILSSGIFGDYIQDGIIVSAGETTSLKVTWTPEQHGSSTLLLI
jgi:rhamnogalacturonan endolyase